MTDITAIYNGKKISQLPEDLFIPPEYLRIILEEFEGPLDLLLYLIKKQNIDITDLPIFPITEQYMSYISIMEEILKGGLNIAEEAGIPILGGHSIKDKEPSIKWIANICYYFYRLCCLDCSNNSWKNSHYACLRAGWY